MTLCRLTNSLLVLLGTACLVSCTSTQLNESGSPSNETAPNASANYEKIIEYYSAGDSEYNGLYDNFEYKAVILNSVVREAGLKKQSEYYQWDKEKTNAEREKFQKEMNEDTRVFMSFFTPDRNNDNLTNTKSIWKIYLDAGGHRYEGKIKRLRTVLAELQALYPFHTRWTTPYEVTFPVATQAIETQSSTFTVTGPLGTRTITFRSAR